MKKTIFLIVFCAGTTMLFSQQNNRRTPPQTVQRSWQKDYPNYDNDNNSWEYRNNQWHRRYQDRDHNNRNVDVYYDRNGRRVMAQSEWDRNDLPDRVKARIKARYRSDNYSAFRIEKPGRGFYFQITIGKKKVYMDERGREVRY
jgi:hypothetical protein